MSKLNLAWVLALLLALWVGWNICRDSSQSVPQVPSDPFSAILQDNSFFSVSPVEFPHIVVLASKITDCESGDDNSAVGKAGERGIAQFMKGTFEWMSKLSETNGDWLNEEDQWKLLLWALENGYQNHWTCYDLVK